MFRKIISLFPGATKTISIRIRKGSQQTMIDCKVGSNLMDVTNSLVNQNVNIYGLCDKQLACTTCRVDIQALYNKLPLPTDEELDVLITTKNFNQKTSRMACQIYITQQLEGMTVRVPDSSKTQSK